MDMPLPPRQGLQLRRLSPHLGAEVEGLDITRPLTPAQVAALREALGEHGVLFFRDQRFDFESQKRFGRYFGELAIHPNTPGPEGHPEILPIHADAHSKVIAGERWHSDVSCTQEPPLGSILHIHTTPSLGGDTLFASLTAAYDALSPRLKAYLEGLTATHSGERNYRRRNALNGVDDRGHPGTDHLACGAARPAAGDHHGFFPRLRQGRGRVWQCHLHRREHAHGERDRAVAHRGEARAVQLRGRGGHRAGHAAALLCRAAHAQSLATRPSQGA
jgi:hypothetical protein